MSEFQEMLEMCLARLQRERRSARIRRALEQGNHQRVFQIVVSIFFPGFQFVEVWEHEGFWLGAETTFVFKNERGEAMFFHVYAEESLDEDRLAHIILWKLYPREADEGFEEDRYFSALALVKDELGL